MIDPQFLEYARTQLAAGIAEKEVRRILGVNGVSEQDIEELFAAIAAPTPLAAAPSAPSTAAPAPANASSVQAPSVAAAPAGVENRTWSKRIPRSNDVTMVISLVLVFGLDLLILKTNPELFAFWAVMLGVFCVFGIFYYLENYVYAKRFANSNSKLDYWILSLVGLRNLIVILNFIPLLQIIGMALAGAVVVPFLLAYALMIYSRSKRTGQA